mgnify:CR=1 FL=1
MTTDATHKDLLDRVQTEAEELMKMHACARCTLLAVAKNLNLASDECLDVALKTAIPLSGGIAGTRNECGGLIGGVMAIGLGLINYNPRTDNPEARKVVTAATKQFYRWFEAEIGHARCYDIRDSKLGRFFDASDPEENRKFIAAGGQELCAGIVGKSARKAAEMILAARQK